MRSLDIASTGMLAQQRNVEVISNNLANMNTTAFQRRRTEFHDLIYQDLRQVGSTSSDSGNVVPTGVQLGLGVKLAAVYRIHQNGQIVTHDGYLLDPGLTVPQAAIDVTINASGQVLASIEGQVALQNVGQIQLATFQNEPGLQAIGDNLLLETPASGSPILGNPAAVGFGSILQGFLETSNVNAVEEISHLISAQRAYEMNSKVIQTSDEMMGTLTALR